MFTGGKGREYRSPWMWGFLAVCLPLAVYLRTLCPTIFVGDSGELVAGSGSLGILHPPGYPLYCLVGRLFALLPVGEVAYRLNLLSALCAALSAGLIFLLVAGLIRRTQTREREQRSDQDALWAGAFALLAGLLCAFSRTLWSQAVVAEVYTLNLFLLLICMILLFWWQQKGESRYFFLFVFVFGLSLAHHPTAVLATPAFLFFLTWHRDELFENWKDPLLAMIFLAVGLSVYLYLPLRALANPPLDWGHPVTMRGVLAHISRASYGSLIKNPRSWQLLRDQLLALVILARKQFGPVFWGLGLAGLIFMFRRSRDWAVLTLCLFLFCGPGVVWLLNFPVTPRDLYLVQVFFIPAFAVVALWTGMGAGWLGGKLLRLMVPLSRRPYRPLGVVLGCLASLLAILPLRGNFAANDRSRQFVAADLGENILATLEPQALLFTSMDTPTFSLAYARIIERKRLDVSLRHTGRADIFRHLALPRGPLDPERRPIYGTTPADLPKISGWAAHQVGIVYQLRRDRMETDDLLSIWDRYRLRGLGGKCAGEDFFLQELVKNYAVARGNLAQELARRGRFQLAIKEGRQAVAMDSSFYGSHLSLGNVYFQMSDYRLAAEAYERALRLAPERLGIVNNLALACLRMGDHQRAIQVYQHSIAVDSCSAKTRNDLGLAYKQAGYYDLAARAYRRAIELDAGYPDPLRNLGVIYAYHRVDFPQAIDLWEQYMSLCPDDADGEMIRAEIQRVKLLRGDEKSSNLRPSGKELADDEHTR